MRQSESVFSFLVSHHKQNQSCMPVGLHRGGSIRHVGDMPYDVSALQHGFVRHRVSVVGISAFRHASTDVTLCRHILAYFDACQSLSHVVVKDNRRVSRCALSPRNAGRNFSGVHYARCCWHARFSLWSPRFQSLPGQAGRGEESALVMRECLMFAAAAGSKVRHVTAHGVNAIRWVTRTLGIFSRPHVNETFAQ